MKILVLGGDGQLGRCLRDQFRNSSNTICFITRNDLDITIYCDLRRKLIKEKPDYIINASAYTDVDDAEDFFILAEDINHLAVKNIANISKEIGSVLVHISTDYVFDGGSLKPYKENDPTSPVTKYGLSKLNGENAIIQSKCNAIIIRTAWVFSEYGKNFLKTMLNLGAIKEELNIVDDQVGAPTYAQDLAEAIIDILVFIKANDSFNDWGVYNFCGENSCSWFDFAQLIFSHANNCNLKIPLKINPVTSEMFPSKAIRPSYSVLDNKKICNIFGIQPSNWSDGVMLAINKIYP